jgi:hypothetical protein
MSPHAWILSVYGSAYGRQEIGIAQDPIICAVSEQSSDRKIGHASIISYTRRYIHTLRVMQAGNPS